MKSNVEPGQEPYRLSEGLAKGLAQRKFLSRERSHTERSSEMGYKNGRMLPKSDPLLGAPSPTPVRPRYARLAFPMGHRTLAPTRRKAILCYACTRR
jgi:hypothetical protein